MRTKLCHGHVLAALANNLAAEAWAWVCELNAQTLRAPLRSSIWPPLCPARP